MSAQAMLDRLEADDSCADVQDLRLMLDAAWTIDLYDDLLTAAITSK
jgi:hypothetical protein